MKTVEYPLPQNLGILDIVEWCEQNSVPMLYVEVIFGEQLDQHGNVTVTSEKQTARYSRRDCRKYFAQDSVSYKYDSIIIREQDYALVRLRF